MANNTAIERYIKRLEKRLAEMSSKTEEILYKHIDIDKKISKRGLEGLEQLIEAIPEMHGEVLEKFSEEELGLYDEGGALLSLIFKLKEETNFTAYIELEESFIRYNVPKETQIKIIFELLKRRELSYMEYCNTLLALKKLLPYPDALEQKLKKITNGMAGTTALEREEYINLLMPLIKEPELESTIEKQREAFRTINEFHVNGKVVAHEAPMLFKLAVNTVHGSSLTENQIDLIMSESRNLYIAKLQAEEADYLLGLRREERELEQQINFEKTQVENKNRRIAIQKLKNFLKGDMPIKFITDEEFKEIEELLITACYGRSFIDKIKRNILTNNRLILEEEKRIKVENAINMYLTDIDKELLDSAQMILATAEETSPVLKKIEEDIMSIERELLKLISEDEEAKRDTIEMINLWLDELRGHLVEYTYSNYKLCMIKPE